MARLAILLGMLFFILPLAASPSPAQGSAFVEWSRTDSGPENSTLKAAIRMPSGDVVLTGSKSGPTGEELQVLRLDVDGNLIWHRQIPNPFGSGAAIVQGLTRNIHNEIVIVCAVTGGATTYDLHFIALDQAGLPVAERVVDHFDWDSCTGLETGPAGNVVISAYTVDPDHYLVAKMDRYFNTIWTVNLGNPGQPDQWAEAIAITPNGDVLVAGQAHDGVQTDVRLDRLSPDGVLLYSKDFGDPTIRDAEARVIAGSNGGTYFAFRWRGFELDWEARLYRISQTGVVQWGMSDPGIVWAHLLEIENDEFIACAVGPGQNGHTGQTFRRFDAAGNILGTRTIELAQFEHYWMRSAQVGPDKIIYASGHATPVGATTSDWFVNALTIEGQPVYEWTFNSGPDQYDFPGHVVPIGDGAIILGGQVNNSTDTDAPVVRLQAELSLPPEVAHVLEGQATVDLEPLAVLDGARYPLRNRDPGSNLSLKQVGVRFEATVPDTYPGRSLKFACTSRSTGSRLAQVIELWNWTTSTWDLAKVTLLSRKDQTTIVDASLTAHVEPATGRVRARLQVGSNTTAPTSHWRVGIDQAVWKITP